MAYIHKDEQIMKYIPKKLHQAILGAYKEDGGEYWIQLNRGWTNHCIRAYIYGGIYNVPARNVKELKEVIKTIHRTDGTRRDVH